MPIEFPSKEQMLYSELAVLDALGASIHDNCIACEFEDEELLFYLSRVNDSIRSAHYRMKFIIKKSQENSNETR